MKTLLPILLLAVGMPVMPVDAQTARQEIHDNILLSASNHLAYIVPEEKLTPAPKGYEPFYMNHYGRHGSRWLLNDNEYSGPINTLRQALDEGKLSPLGIDVLHKLERFYPSTRDRLGDLSDIGEIQHHGIGRRMTKNFPEIFSGKTAQVDARSTVVIRCILSMVAECEELTAFNPTLKMHNDVSEKFQWYLNHDWDGKVSRSGRKRGKIVDYYRQKYTHPERLCRSLFTDESFWNNHEFRAGSFMRALFNVTTNMQSHSFGEDLYPIFTEEEAYDQWRWKNIDWYLGYAHAPQTDGNMAFNQRFLLRNMIETADTVLASKTFTNGASLRFGHEVCVMPLACLMELDSCGVRVDDLDHLEDYWVNYRIYPMACNIQVVYYRPKAAKPGALSADDILVKVLLNEKEATLPIDRSRHPYYRWTELRKYYLDKLDAYDRD